MEEELKVNEELEELFVELEAKEEFTAQMMAWQKVESDAPQSGC